MNLGTYKDKHKTLNLEQMGVQEMDAKEVKSVDGGWIGTALAILMFDIYIYDNADDFAEGFAEGRRRN